MSEESGTRIFAVVGLFDGARQLVDAIPRVRALNLGRIEAYTPHPIHGIDEALGLRKSPVAGMVLVMGIVGAIAALVLQGWCNAVDYPTVTGGKVLFSWQAFVPIMFELMVLFASFTAGFGMLILLNRLPVFRHPMLLSRSMASITRDKLALAIETRIGEKGAAEIDLDAAREALLASGAESVEVVPFPEPLGPVSSRFVTRAFLTIAVACLVSGFAMYWGVKLFPVLPPMIHMETQPRLDAQAESSYFKDGAGMRPPVAGTVARGHLPYAIKTQDEAAVLSNPLPRTEPVLRRGKKVFENHCGVCHGALGDGVTTLTAAYGAKAANLLTQAFRDYPDGKIYHVIMRGKNAMPSYAADIPEDDRWAVIHYVRALERAQNATDEDLNR